MARFESRTSQGLWLMARVLVLYGSTEGQTATIVERIAEVLDSAGHVPTLVHGKPVPDGFRLSKYDAVVGASVHREPISSTSLGSFETAQRR